MSTRDEQTTPLSLGTVDRITRMARDIKGMKKRCIYEGHDTASGELQRAEEALYDARCALAEALKGQRVDPR